MRLRRGQHPSAWGLASRSAPLYWRLLRLRRLRPRPATTFLLFEGSILLGVLLALAEIVSPWGAPAVPVAVAVMVKLNDIVAGTLDLRPLAEAQLRTPRPRDHHPIGMSQVPSAGRPTTRIPGDDAVADPDAQPDRPGVVRGVAAVPLGESPDEPKAEPSGEPRRPQPGPLGDEPPTPEGSAETEPTSATPGDPARNDPGRNDPGRIDPSWDEGGDRRMRGNKGRFAFE